MANKKDVDGRDKPGHDERANRFSSVITLSAQIPDSIFKEPKHASAASPRDAPESLINLSPKEGVGNAGCPWHP